MARQGNRGRPPHEDILTPAEWRVVEGVRHGLTNTGIAARRNISVDAVKYHLPNILQKLDLPRRAALRTWPGVRKDSVLYSEEPVMNDFVRLDAVGQVSRTVKDVVAARRWYGEVLGLTHLYSYGDLAFFDCGGLRLFLTQGDEKTGDSILYFRVRDIRAAHAELTARGVAFLDAPHMIHRHDDGMEEWMTFFSDQEGRPLALMAQVRPEAGG